MQINDTVAIVTGGASGLGEGAVEHFIAHGGRVAIFDLNAGKGEALAEKHKGKAIFAKVNVSDEASVTAGIAATKEAFGAVHVLVNCAGIPGKIGRIVSKKGPMPLDDFRKVIDINLIGTFNVGRLAAAEMLKNEPLETGERGVIINISSLAGIEGQMGQICYAASKAGVIGMMLPMVRDLSQFGVRVLTVAPGLFETPMGAGAPPEVKDMLIATLEFPRRMGQPSEFAALVGHLVENAYMNGELIRIDAGTRAPPR
ncbi:MAG: SDR family NAD(P)-dependent oxidoreductase [Alphaproteobacteria bacterium]|nr:SDR family NAD(P)-dependent oxidoreductase [Alphaproteobacteria bacterium]MDE2013385.1 SDR family NAD(P)-dependent oxidoreductase [Alphaproteobacteria bacterium]MDE2075093.1 SDR family NAD(P)-dependent oxidoreductase [Alphaproteobacteria bacterium]